MLNAKWKVYALDMFLADWLDGQAEQLFDALEEAPHGCEDGVFEGFESYPRPEFTYLSNFVVGWLHLLGGNAMTTKTCTIYTPEDEEISYEVEYEAEPYVPARIYGDPDDCYPEEGGEIDLISVKLNGLEVMGTLDEDVLDEIERQCWEDCDGD